MKFLLKKWLTTIHSRTPRWVRGLKSSHVQYTIKLNESHPTMGAWIEIKTSYKTLVIDKSHPTMGAWIEITYEPSFSITTYESHPTMGAWIEIFLSLRRRNESTCRSHPTMGAWIEISLVSELLEANTRRTPRWVRGLKLHFQQCVVLLRQVAPHDGCVD